MLQHVENLFGEEEARKRIVITADNVPQDDTGLRQLIVSNEFHKIIPDSTRTCKHTRTPMCIHI